MKTVFSPRALLLCLAALGGLGTATPSQAGESLAWNELNLAGASGVPNAPDHKYVFKGLMSIRRSSSSTGFSFDKGLYTHSSTTTAAKFWVEGVGKWNASKNQAEESLVFQGDVQANLRSVFKCNSDPWLGKQPCAVIAVYFNTEQSTTRDWAGMVKRSRLPLTVQIVTLAAATELSKISAANAPPPPPPPPSAPKKEPPRLRAAKPARAVAQPVAPKPALAIVGASAQVQPNCAKPQPAAIISVKVRNTGTALAADNGRIYAKELGGTTNLGSGGLPLPAINPGETKSVKIPVITLSPYRSLAGTHKLGVYLNPVLRGGQPSFSKPVSPYQATVSFPADHCNQLRPMTPSAPKRNLRPDEIRGLRPQPEPPGQPAAPQTR